MTSSPAAPNDLWWQDDIESADGKPNSVGTPCDEHCWITTSWNQAHQTLTAEPLKEHPPVAETTMRDISQLLYEPIHFWQFRILRILPSEDVNSLLKCELIVAGMLYLDMVALRDTGTNLEYEALSYSWGRPDFTASISCNDRMVPVTSHLAEALRHLRFSDTSRYIWCDAICINQYDLVEKGQQVQLMYTIFKRATQVVAWLGVSTAESCRILSHLQAAWRHVNAAHDVRDQVDRLYRSHESSQECAAITTYVKQALRHFTSVNPWFKRCWIRQEVFAAKSLQFVSGTYRFGQETLDANPFLYFSRSLDLILRRPSYNPIRDSRFFTPPWVLAVFENTEGFKASLEHDLIYAVQNIVEGERRPEDRLLPSINYAKSPSAVFQDWAKSIINTTDEMWPLNVFEDRSASQAMDLPSWVPDLRIPKHRILVSPNVIEFDPEWPPDAPRRPIAEYHQNLKDEGILRLRRCLRIPVSHLRVLPDDYDHDIRYSPSRPTRGGTFLEGMFRSYGLDEDLSYADSRPSLKVHRDQGDFLLADLKAMNYKLCDVDHNALGHPVRFNSVLVPARFELGDIMVIMCDFVFARKRMEHLAYALRSIGNGKYQYLGLCKGFHVAGRDHGRYESLCRDESSLYAGSPEPTRPSLRMGRLDPASYVFFDHPPEDEALEEFCLV